MKKGGMREERCGGSMRGVEDESEEYGWWKRK